MKAGTAPCYVGDITNHARPLALAAALRDYPSWVTRKCQCNAPAGLTGRLFIGAGGVPQPFKVSRWRRAWGSMSLKLLLPCRALIIFM